MVLRGECRVLFAFDIGLAIDVDRARAILSADGGQTRTLHEPRPPAKHLEFHAPPVRTSEGPPPRGEGPLTIAGLAVSPDADATLFDFGAVCLSYRIPFEGGIETLLALSVALNGHEGLHADAQRRIADLAASIGGAVSRGRIASPVEDYAVLIVEPGSLAGDPAGFVDANRGSIACVLRADARPLSPQEEADALSCRIAYSDRDLTLIDWNGALVIHDEPDDLLSVLEFANIELLEMRHLDDQLDRALDEAYRLVQNPQGWLDVLLRHRASDQQRIANMQMDSALLFEGVNNALKLLGDQYLARVYRLAGQRLHLPEWDATILRKLDTLNSIYEKMSDRQANRRMEVLEWIIILLIAFEVVMGLWDRLT